MVGKLLKAGAGPVHAAMKECLMRTHMYSHSPGCADQYKKTGMEFFAHNLNLTFDDLKLTDEDKKQQIGGAPFYDPATFNKWKQEVLAPHQIKTVLLCQQLRPESQLFQLPNLVAQELCRVYQGR